MTGAQVMVKCLEKEGVSVIFGYPGAAICPFYDALYASSLRHILVRQEQNAAHAASGYARASGKVGVCVVTSGPGATNLITGLATAHMDSIPLVAITGQVRSDLLGRDVFQEADITGACEPFTKCSYLVKDANDLARILKEAFHIASTGRPGPVLVDVPMDLQKACVENFVYPEKAEIIGYKPRTQGHALQIKRALETISLAERPVLCAGGGILSGKAKKELAFFAEKTGIPVVSTMMGIGALSPGHPLYLGMLGTYGVEPANRAIREADLLILCGARVGDRSLAKPGQIAEKAKVIHIDIDPAEIGKNMKAHIPIVGDVRLVLGQLAEKTEYCISKEWAAQLAEWHKAPKKPPLRFEGFVEPQSFMRKLSSMLPEKSILVADVGQNQIWSANHFCTKNGVFLTSGGLGTMGYSIPAAMGAKLAKPGRTVVAVCGDGAFQMSMCELGTAVQNQINLKLIVMRNIRLGMVRELQERFYGGRYFASMLDSNFDPLKIAAAYKIPGAELSSDEEAERALKALLEAPGPALLLCNVSPMNPSV